MTDRRGGQKNKGFLEKAVQSTSKSIQGASLLLGIQWLQNAITGLGSAAVSFTRQPTTLRKTVLYGRLHLRLKNTPVTF